MYLTAARRRQERGCVARMNRWGGGALGRSPRMGGGVGRWGGSPPVARGGSPR